jgi:hypothetical protein
VILFFGSFINKRREMEENKNLPAAEQAAEKK